MKIFSFIKALFSYDIKERDRPDTHLMWVIVLTFIAVATWAYYSEIDRVVTANAKAYPYAKLQTVEHFEGGRVDKILVQKGDSVEKGDLLITLSPIQTLGELTIQTDLVAELTVKQSRLMAEYQNAPKFTVDAIFTKSHSEIMAQEQAIFRERNRQRKVAIEAKVAEMESAKSKLGAAEAGLRASDEEFRTMKLLFEKGLEPELSFVKAERSHAEAVSALETSRQEVIRSQSAVDATLRDYQTQILKELSEVRSNLTAARENIRVAADKADRSELRAPSSGIVNNVLVSTVGGTVKPGETVVEIVPEGSQIFIEANIAPADIGFIEPGQAALIKLTAYDYSVFGSLSGRVTVIAADTTTEDSGEQFYKVSLQPLTKYLDGKGRELQVIPGMEAQVDVIVGKRSVLDYLLSPLLRVTQDSLREK
ncbi:MAG: HlyD family type I secretion periplasmic adaptor subunit [Betaproteobacteria bacterium]